MSLIKSDGVSPAIREAFISRDKALMGDIVMVITPATVAPVPTAAAWTREVEVSIETAAGVVHDWLTKDFATTASVADTGGGTASILPATTLTIVNGKAVIVVSGTAATWANTQTDTVTIGNITVLGVTVTGGTSVETFTT